MGSFTYDSALRVEFDDRLLLHLQAVISGKLRRREPFLFTWTKPAEDGGGRTSVWIEATVPLVFDYSSSEVPDINRAWIDELTNTTHRMTGLQIVPEPKPATSPAPARVG